MSGRVRLLILLALIIVIGAIAAVFLLGGDDSSSSNNGGNSGGNTTSQQGATATPTEIPATPLPTQELVDVVVAVQPINRGTVIEPGTVELRPWPKDAIPENTNFIFELEEVFGLIARTDLYVEQPVLLSMVVPDLANLSAVGSDAAAIIPRGSVAVAIPVDRLTSVAYAIQPGDRVDVIASLLYVDIDSDFQSILPNSVNILTVTVDEDGPQVNVGAELNGRIETVSLPVQTVNGTQIQSFPALEVPVEEARPRLVTQRTIQNALVIWVDNFPLDGILFRPVPPPTPTPDPEAETANQPAAQGGAAPPPTAIPVPDIVTLAVPPQEAVVLTWMVEARIPITFALRSASDNTEIPTEQVTLGYIMRNYGVDVPPKEEFSIQPAIRSIRQLIPAAAITADSN